MAEVVLIDVDAFSGGPTRIGVITNADVTQVWRWDVEVGPSGVLQTVPKRSPVLLRSEQSEATNLWNDFESPQGQMVAYSTSVHQPTQAELALAVIPPASGAWLVPIADPHAASPFRVGKDGFGEWSQPAIQSVTEVPGRPEPHVVEFGRGARRATLTLVAVSGFEAARLRAAVDVGGTYFVSWPPRQWPGHVAGRYAMLGDVTETPLGSDNEPAWEVSLPLIPVTRPDPLATFTQYEGWAWSAADPAWSDGPVDWQETP